MTRLSRPFPTIALTSLLLAALPWALSSCAKRESSDTSSMDAPPADTAAQAAMVSDAQIAAIVVTANNADIENGRQAETKAQDAEVKAFARQMIADHTVVNEKANALVSRLGVTPEDNPTSLGMKSSQDSLRAMMGTLAGSTYDKTYVDGEVTFHQNMLDALDQTLIPNAQNPDLKALLTEVRPVIAMHLDHAKRLQTKLGGTASR